MCSSMGYISYVYYTCLGLPGCWLFWRTLRGCGRLSLPGCAGLQVVPCSNTYGNSSVPSSRANKIDTTDHSFFRDLRAYVGYLSPGKTCKVLSNAVCNFLAVTEIQPSFQRQFFDLCVLVILRRVLASQFVILL